jgi:hypothetical protein
MFQPKKGYPKVTQFDDLAAEMYQLHSLRWPSES